MSERGMKKWAPYKSLPEQNPHILNMKKNKHKVDKPQLSNEKAEEINNLLLNYHDETLKIKYYKNGEILEIESKIKKIDALNKTLIINPSLKILFKNLVDIEKVD